MVTKNTQLVEFLQIVHNACDSEQKRFIRADSWTDPSLFPLDVTYWK